MATLPPEAKALLDTIASTESPGYNVLYGGGTFSSYAAHPNQKILIKSGPNAGKYSSAAGKYQFLNSTWQEAAKALGLKDFSPESQDAAAWWLAQRDYKAATGQDLATVLKSGDPQALAGVGKALSGTWTSLPSGIEATTNGSRFVNSYTAALAQPGNAALGAINSASPTGVNPLAYAPTPAGLPTMNRSGLIPPIPAAPPTMNRSGPPTALPPPAPLTITLPEGSVVIPGKPYVGKDGSITTFDAQGNRTHVNPPLVNIGEEMGKNTIIGGLARKYGADFMDQGKAAVQSGLNTAGTAAMDIAASLPGKVADLGSAWNSLFAKPPLLTPGANAAPGVPPKMVPPAAIPSAPKPYVAPKSAPFIGSGIPMPTKPVASLPVSTVSEHAPMLSPLPAPTVPPPSAFAPFNYGQFYGPNAGVSGMSVPGALPAPAPLVPGPMMNPPVSPPPLKQIKVAPVPPPVWMTTTATGKSVPVGSITATGSTVLPDGSIKSKYGHILSGPSKPVGSKAAYDMAQAKFYAGVPKSIM